MLGEKWWVLIDNTDGDISENNRSISSKWEFYGTRQELLDWLPDYDDDPNWTYIDSRNPSKGTVWIDESNFKIKNVRYTSLSRFQWAISVTAAIPKSDTPGGGGVNPGDVIYNGKTDYEMTQGSFTLSSDMTGYDWDTNVQVWKDRTDTDPENWTTADDCPFTVRPEKTETNKTFTVGIISKIEYVDGDPLSNGLIGNVYEGVMEFQVSGTTYKGLVVGQGVELVYDKDNNPFTKSSISYMLAPEGREWNLNWQ